MENVLLEVMHTTHKLVCRVSINEHVQMDEIRIKMTTLGFLERERIQEKN